MARILVVDDDRWTVSGMERLLREDGHEVRGFTRGADAVEALSREPFDTVVTDLEMPHVDGHAVLEAARENQPAVCLLVVTVNGDDVGHLGQQGICAIADKPLDYDALATHLRECHARGGPKPTGCTQVGSDGAAARIVSLRRGV